MTDIAPSPALIRPLATPALDPARARQTAEQFETAFLSQMLKPMFEGLSADGLFGGGQAETQWRSFLVDAMAQQTARAGGVGLADHVLAEMMRMQEVPS